MQILGTLMGALRQIDQAVLNCGGDRVHAQNFLELRLIACDAVHAIGDEILY